MSRVQLEFDLNGGGGGNPPSADTKVAIDLFLGLQLAKEANNLATDVAHGFMQRLGVTEPIRPPHVTLWELGIRDSFSNMDLAAKKEELSSVVFEPFILEFDEIMSFQSKGNKAPLVLCCSQPNPNLLELHRLIAEAQAQPGVDGGKARAFNPHVTLFYTHHSVLRQPLKTPVRWLVREFHMLWSHTGACEHESLWHWPSSA